MSQASTAMPFEQALGYRLSSKVKEVWINGTENHEFTEAAPSQAFSPAVEPQKPPAYSIAPMAARVNMCVNTVLLSAHTRMNAPMHKHTKDK